MTQQPTDGEQTDRRTYLKTISAAGLVGSGLLAGCTGSQDTETTTTAADADSAETTANQEDETTEASDSDGATDLKIGMETHFTSGAWVTALVEGVQFYAEDKGYDFNLFTNEQDAQQQIEHVRQMINQEYDGIVLVPWNSDTVTNVVEEARDAGIAVYTVDIDAPTDAVSMNVSWDDTVAATTAGEELVSRMQEQHPDRDQYRVLEVRAPPGQNISAARHDPFVDYIESTDNVEIVGTLNGEWSRSTATQRVREWINANNAPDGIYSANFSMGIGTQNALESQDLQATTDEDDHITHVQLDGSSESHQMITDGYIDLAIDQPVYMYGPIALEYMEAEITEGEDALPEVGTEVTADDLQLQTGEHKGMELWTEPIWAPGNITETDSGHRRFVTNYVTITADNAEEPYLWGNIWN